MSNNLNYKQVANVTRRKWDVEAYERKAQARQQQLQEQEDIGERSARRKPSSAGEGSVVEDTTTAATLQPQHESSSKVSKEEFIPAPTGAAGPEGSKRAFLKARKNKVSDIDNKVGETSIVSVEAAVATSSNKGLDDLNLLKGDSIATASPSSSQLQNDGAVVKTGIGWHCKVCDCFLKDSHTYLDHINGRKHQRKLGYSMRVERSTKDQLLSRLGQLSKSKEQEEQRKQREDPTYQLNYEDIVRSKDEEEQRRKEERQRQRKERKLKAKQSQLEPDAPAEEEAHNNDEKEADPNANGKQDNGDDGEEEEGVNPDMAALMGFSGFGSSNR